MNVTFEKEKANIPVSFGGGGSFRVGFKEGASSSDYKGEYEVTPTDEVQVLPTAHKTLSRDVVVNPIPSNYGLITWDGCVLTVS